MPHIALVSAVLVLLGGPLIRLLDSITEFFPHDLVNQCITLQRDGRKDPSHL